jgi:hypothetical protein
MTSNQPLDIIDGVRGAALDAWPKSPRSTAEPRQSDQGPVHHRFGRSHGLACRNKPTLEPEDLVGERDDAVVRMGVRCRCADAPRGPDFASARLEHQSDECRGHGPADPATQ